MDGAQEVFDPVEIPLWIDLLAVFIAGLSGSLSAIRQRFDIAGVMVVTLVAALGGGIIRDVLIGRGPPAALANADYLYTAFGAAAIGFLFRQLVHRVNPWFVPIDAAAMGLYTFVGMQKGLNFDLPVITAMLLGVITATGGGLLRDILSAETPNVLRPGHLSLTAAIAGAMVYAGLHAMGIPGYIDVWIVVGVVMILRLASEYFGWTTPEAGDVPQRMAAAGGVVMQAPQRLRSSVPSSPTASYERGRVGWLWSRRPSPGPEGDAMNPTSGSETTTQPGASSPDDDGSGGDGAR